MTSRRTVVVLAALGVATALLVAGCGGGSEDVTVNRDDTTVKIETSDGTATVTGGKSGELPAGWPDEITIPEGGTITGGVAVTTPGQEGWTAVVEYPDASVADVVAELTSSLEAAGYTSEGTVTTGEGSMVMFKGAQYAVTAMISAEGSGSKAAFTIGRET